MKIGIISLGCHGTNENFGALLQIYAFQEYLKKDFNADVSVIDYYGLAAGRAFNTKLFTFLWNINKKRKLDKRLRARIRKNEEFIRIYLNTTTKYNYKTIDNAIMNYDYYIAESDVIWDPTFRNKGFDKVYFLNAKSFNAGKRIVYAASLGDLNLSENHIIQLKAYIENLKAWSVREKCAKDYFNDKLNLQTETLIDPTLLHDEYFYNNLIKYPLEASIKPYVLIYFPAEVNFRIIEKAQSYANKYGYELICISRNALNLNNIDVIIDITVAEFLYYVKNCSVLFCDSFHGICFSIIYKKNFFAFDRKDGKKIKDVCSKFNLLDRVVSDSEITNKDIDYDEVYRLLSKERIKSYNWLKKELITEL